MIYLIVVLAGKQSVNIALSLFLLCLLALVGRYLVAVALFKRNLYYLESAVIVIELSSYILFVCCGYAVFLIVSVKYLLAHLVYKLNSLV